MSRPIPIGAKGSGSGATTPRGGTAARQAQSLPAVPPSPYLGSYKPPAKALEGMPPLELPETPDVRRNPIAMSLPAHGGGGVAASLHSLRIESKRMDSLSEEGEDSGPASSSSVGVAGSVRVPVSSSLVTALSALRVADDAQPAAAVPAAASLAMPAAPALSSSVRDAGVGASLASISMTPGGPDAATRAAMGLPPLAGQPPPPLPPAAAAPTSSSTAPGRTPPAAAARAGAAATTTPGARITSKTSSGKAPADDDDDDAGASGDDELQFELS